MEEEQLMTITYTELQKLTTKKAREMVRKVLAQYGGNMSNCARILKIARKTVRRGP